MVALLRQPPRTAPNIERAEDWRRARFGLGILHSSDLTPITEERVPCATISRSWVDSRLPTCATVKDWDISFAAWSSRIGSSYADLSSVAVAMATLAVEPPSPQTLRMSVQQMGKLLALRRRDHDAGESHAEARLIGAIRCASDPSRPLATRSPISARMKASRASFAACWALLGIG